MEEKPEKNLPVKNRFCRPVLEKMSVLEKGTAGLGKTCTYHHRRIRCFEIRYFVVGRKKINQ